LNFLTRGNFSPLNNLSAPTFLPLVGGQTLLAQDDVVTEMMKAIKRSLKKKYFMLLVFLFEPAAIH
jgi:hypothetical protein